MYNLKQLERTASKIERLADIYEPFVVLSRSPLPVTHAENRDFGPVREGYEWGGDFVYANFECTLPDLPRPLWLECDTDGVEHLIFADGKPLDMTDWAREIGAPSERLHRFVSLEEVPAGARLRVEAYAGHTMYGTMPYDAKITFGWSKYRERCVFHGIYAVRLDTELKEFLLRLRLLVSYYRSGGSPWNKIEEFKIFEELFRKLSLLPERPEKASVRAGNELLKKYFGGKNARASSPRIGLVGHSHLDTAWLWPVEETKHKAVRTAVNAVRLLEKYPNYTFIMSSVLYMDWIRKSSPDLFGRIKKLVREGRFEPNGAAWVECDCNLTGGEALIRQFLRGQSFLKEHFGYRADVFWLPDTFGYSGALPQIMRGCGVKYFLTTKLSWNDTNRFPLDAFRWRGIDGSEVIAHFNTTHAPADPRAVRARMEGMLNKHINDCALIAYGYGDGGGGPDEDMVRTALMTEETFADARVKHTTVSAFMEELSAEDLPVYAGELYLELHRGTLTMHHDIKKYNRQLEILLHDAEFLGSSGQAIEEEKLRKWWDILLLNQFHDILPGTCIARVNDIAKAELKGAVEECAAAVRPTGKPYVNTLSFAREETLETEDGEQEYEDFDGRKRRIGRFAFAPFGEGRRVRGPEKSPFVFENGTLCTPYGKAVLAGGKILSYVCFGRETAAGALNELRVAEDMPRLWDNWDVDADLPLIEKEAEFISSRVVSDGPHEFRIRCFYRIGKNSEMTEDVVFDAYSPLVTFENKLNWQDDHLLLRAYFETDLFAPAVKNEIQFGWLERPTTRNSSEQQAMFEVCNHKWSDLSETNFGAALLNDCKYGFGCEGKTMHLTLCKGGTHPDERGDRGVKYFSYGFLPHEGGFSAKSVVRPAYRFNYAPARCADCRSPVLNVSGGGIIVESVRRNAAGTVLRLYESERSAAKCKIEFSKDFDVYECDMLDEERAGLGKTSALELAFRPFEIKTLLLK